jgi:Domain of unknown function (DUF4395)
MSNGISRVDRTALKINQGSIVTLLVVAFALKLEWLVAIVSLVMIVGTVVPSAGAFKLLYSRLLRPLGIVHPEIVEEDNVQHLFAQGLGGLFLAVSFYSLAVQGSSVVGWSLAFLVVVLAFVNLTVNFCVGCYLYLRLRRISFFTRAALKRVTND